MDEMREEFWNHKQYDYMKSFDIAKNYKQILEAARIIKDKPSRVLMKFETFDHKFSICFTESKKFNWLCGLIKNYNHYLKIITKNEFETEESKQQNTEVWYYETS